MSEIVEAEIVQASAELVPDEPERFVLTKRHKDSIKEKLQPYQDDEGNTYPGATLEACAQYAGLDPEVLRQAVNEGLANQDSPNRRFALTFAEAMADREKLLAQEGFRLAREKKDAAFFRVALERQHKAWAAPEKKSTVNNNLTIVGKLNLANQLRANQSLPTGD